MFEALSHAGLQLYWWAIISLLGGILVFMFFVQGGQTLVGRIGQSDAEKTMIINSLGRKWELTYTTLVTFGGALFAAFPLFYSVSFGGAYWVWIAILLSFTIQAVAYEFRRKPGNFLGAGTYEVFLLINGFVGVTLIGTAVGTFYSGANFQLGEMNFSTWTYPLRGLEAAFNAFNVILGLAVLFLSRTLGAMYFIHNIEDDEIRSRSRNQVAINFIAFLVLFLTFLVWLLFRSGYEITDGKVVEESMHYGKSLLEMPVVLVLMLVGVVLVLYGVFTAFLQKSRNGIWFTGPGVVLTVFTLFLLAGYNNSAFYPSIPFPEHSLTIHNASSSLFTLKTMSYVSLGVPFILAYISWVWRLMDSKKMTRSEVGEDDSHLY